MVSIGCVFVAKGRGTEAELGILDTAIESDSMGLAEEETGKSDGGRE